MYCKILYTMCNGEKFTRTKCSFKDGAPMDAIDAQVQLKSDLAQDVLWFQVDDGHRLVRSSIASAIIVPEDYAEKKLPVCAGDPPVLEGVCECCGRLFVERLRILEELGETWSGALAAYRTLGVCPACYNFYSFVHGHSYRWNNGDWLEHFMARIKQARTSKEVLSLVASARTRCNGIEEASQPILAELERREAQDAEGMRRQMEEKAKRRAQEEVLYGEQYRQMADRLGRSPSTSGLLASMEAVAASHGIGAAVESASEQLKKLEEEGRQRHGERYGKCATCAFCKKNDYNNTTACTITKTLIKLVNYNSCDKYEALL